MAEAQTLSGNIEVRYEPDAYTEAEVRDGASWPMGAGHYTIGVNVDGAFFPLARLKGGGVQKKLAAAKAAREQAASETPADAPAAAPETPPAQ